MTFRMIALLAGLGGLGGFVWDSHADTPAKPSVEGWWLTEDRALVIEVATCQSGAEELCGFVRAIPGAKDYPALKKHADDVCGLPILYDLKHQPRKHRWGDGQLFDLETEKSYDAYVKIKQDALIQDGILKVRVYEKHEAMGVTLDWMSTRPSYVGCD